MSVMKERICCLVIAKTGFQMSDVRSRLRSYPKSQIRHPTSLSLPVHHRPVLGVVTLLIPPVVIDLVGQGVLIKLDAQARSSGQIEIAIAHRERLLQVSLAERDLLLAQEIRNGR